MRVALVQMDLAWEDVAENHRRARRHLEEAEAQGARLALLPEMFCTGFSMDSDRIAQPPGGPSEAFLRDTARELAIWILASIPETGQPRPRNMALLAAPDGSVTRYAKIHPFTFGGEDRVYTGGERIVTVAVEGVRVTPFVCYDLRFLSRFASPPRTRISSPSSRTGRSRAERRGAPFCAPGRSKTSATSRASTAPAKAAGCATPETLQSSHRGGMSSSRAPTRKPSSSPTWTRPSSARPARSSRR